LADIETIADQLVEVQTQLAYQEDTVQALNRALASQQQEILVLRRQLQLLKQRLDEQGSAGPAADTGMEKPPHY
jgi:SlyX protein